MGVILLLAIGLSTMAWKALRLESELVQSIALADARQFADAITEFRTLYASEVVERVRATGTKVTHDYKDHEGAIPLPATLSILLGNQLGEHADTQIMLYSDHPFPWRATKRNADSQERFEAKALTALRKNAQEPYYAFVENKDGTVLKFASADLMRSSCVDCHNNHPQTPKSDWKVGDVRGVLSVTKSLTGPTNRARLSLRGMIPVMLGTSLLGILLLGLLASRLRKSAVIAHSLAAQRSQNLSDLHAEMEQRQHAEAEQGRLREQFQYAQKLETIGLLAGGVAHDFNNHLQGILGNAALAKSKTAPQTEIQSHLSEIEQSVSRASKLVKQLLAYAGQGSFTKENLNLSELIKEVQPLLATAHGGNIRVEYELAKELPLFVADRTQLEQVLMNFVTNAAEAHDSDEGKITVRTGVVRLSANEDSDRPTSTAPDGAYIFMEASDNGCGMDEETIRQMFDPYFTKKGHGHGLGLAACQGIVHSYEGFIQVRSELNVGTSIRALFPLVKDNSKEIRIEIFEKTATADIRTILLVDDDKIVRSVAKQLIKRTGFGVIECASGVEAISVYKSRRSEIAVVILDLKMAGMSGQETFRELRKADEKLPVIISSGFGKDSDIQELKFDALVYFLQKPYDLSEFMDALKQVGLAPHDK
jgi:signal transduction histidine kinase/ActR/RegA family two-component response regulator